MLGDKRLILAVTVICALMCACSGPGAQADAGGADGGGQTEPQADGDSQGSNNDSGAPGSGAGGDAPGGASQAGPVAPAPGGWMTISAEEARRMMSGGGYVLLDARTEEEYREAHIEGAVLIPFDEIELRAGTELPDKDSVILVYCRSGRRSAIAAEALAGMGYARVYDFGGIQDWPYETVSGG